MDGASEEKDCRGGERIEERGEREGSEEVGLARSLSLFHSAKPYFGLLAAASLAGWPAPAGWHG